MGQAEAEFLITALFFSLSLSLSSRPSPSIVDTVIDPNTGDVYMLDHDEWRRYDRPKNDSCSFRHFEIYGRVLNLALNLLLSIVMYSVEEPDNVDPTPPPTPAPVLPDPDPIIELDKEIEGSCCKYSRILLYTIVVLESD